MPAKTMIYTMRDDFQTQYNKSRGQTEGIIRIQEFFWPCFIIYVSLSVFKCEVRSTHSFSSFLLIINVGGFHLKLVSLC